MKEVPSNSVKIHSNKISLSQAELLIILKTFLLDTGYLILVVGVLLNLAYLLLGIFIQPLSQATAEVYAVQQAQGISQEDAIALAGQASDGSALWISLVKIVVLFSGVLFFFVLLSTYFKSVIWSLLRRKPYRSFLRFSALSLLLILCFVVFALLSYFLFQGWLAQILLILCALLIWVSSTAIRFCYEGNCSIKENIAQSIRVLIRAEKSLRGILISLTAFIALIIIIGIPSFAASSIYSFYLSILFSLLLFSFLRWYFVRSMERVLDGFR